MTESAYIKLAIELLEFSEMVCLMNNIYLLHLSYKINVLFT